MVKETGRIGQMAQLRFPKYANSFLDHHTIDFNIWYNISGLSNGTAKWYLEDELVDTMWFCLHH